MDRRQALQERADYTGAQAISDAVSAAKRGDEEGRLGMSAAAAWAAFA